MTMTMKLQHSQDTTMVTQKQGIVTILGCATETNTASAASLRRTLSADMSSIKWLPQNGFMKRIGSSEQLKNNIADNSGDYYEEETKEVVDGEAEAERERLEIWSSIQRNKKEEQEKAGTLDTWSSLLSLKTKDEISKSLPATPYIHPLVKTKSSLSEKSLEICTESLGSETGSDGLVSSYPPSETEDSEEKEQEEQEEEKVKEEVLPEEEEEEVVKYNYHVTTTTTKKSSSPRSFPPPLPSLSSQTGPSLHMRPYRDNGRLVLEAVSLPSQNNFCVQRQDGRLVLTFANTQQDDDVADNIEKENDAAGVVMEELEEEFGAFEEEKEGEDDDEDEYEDEEDGEESEIVIEKEKITNASTVNVNVNVNRLIASKVVNNNNKGIGLVNRNPKWSEKFNEVVNFEDVDVMETTQMVQSLPPRPPSRVARLIPSPTTKSAAKAAAAAAAAASSFNSNAYENYWRTKPTATAKDSIVHHQVMNNNDYAMKKNSGNKIIVSGDMNQVSNEKQQLLVLRGKNGDYLVHNLKSCKDSRRSFLFWEPYCIATS